MYRSILTRAAKFLISLCFIWAGFIWAGFASAAIDVYDFDNNSQRERYQTFIEELRCPKCKNNNLAGTNSQIAIDLRRELHRMVMEGQTDEEIIDFMVTRYGDFVLYRPRLTSNTMALYAGPYIFAGLGLLVIGFIVWHRKRAIKKSNAELSPEEQAKLDKLLNKKKSK